MDELTAFLAVIGQEVDDADEESFLLFAQSIPSTNLGFIDSRATTLDLTLHDQDYTIHQSPTLLSSSRAGGTTGAVLWKITPLVAEWLSSRRTNPLWTHERITSSSVVVELGCGISGLIALAVAPGVRHYVVTDQDYVFRLLRENLVANPPVASFSGGGGRGKPRGGRRKAAMGSKAGGRGAGGSGSGGGGDENPHPNITFTSLDWELDVAASLKQSVELAPSEEDTGPTDEEEEEEEDRGFDLVVSCDCIYNEALVAPFVRTCADICGLRPVYNPDEPPRSKRNPTICVIAQQQRSPEVFEAWLQETMRVFRVWRVGDEVLKSSGLGSGSGYLVHVLLLRGDAS